MDNTSVLNFIEDNKILKNYFLVYTITKNGYIYGKAHHDFLERIAVLGSSLDISGMEETAINSIGIGSQLKDFKKTKSFVVDKITSLFFDIGNKDKDFFSIDKIENIDLFIDRLNYKYLDKKEIQDSVFDDKDYVDLSDEEMKLLNYGEPLEMFIDNIYVPLTGYTMFPSLNEYSKISIKHLKELDIKGETQDEDKFYFVLKEVISKDLKKKLGVTQMCTVYTLIAVAGIQIR